MIKVEEVAPFVFSFERAVTIQGAEKKYSLLVNTSVLRDDLMFVHVLEEDEDTGVAFVQLPGETLNDGTRVYVPSAALVRNVSRLA